MKINTVMIIDDSDSDQLLTKMKIQDYNASIEILQAYDGEEALEILDQMDTQPDVIFLDMNMPRMNGLEFLEQYDQRTHKSVVVAMLSASIRDQDKAAVHNYDCVKKYFIKLLDSADMEALEAL